MTPRRSDAKRPFTELTIDEATLERAAQDLVRLVDRASPSGAEAPAVDEAEAIARDLGLPTRRLPVAPGRDNLLVGDAQDPRVLLCTHLDVVEPHVPASRDESHVMGRGSADAKGQAVAMLHALSLLARESLGSRAACLLVVGEEQDHAGALAALESGLAPAYVILGEPCGLDPAPAQKGALKLRLTAAGVAGHSAYPDVGVSAVHRLVSALGRLLSEPLPADSALGETTVNVGTLSGGLAANVIAPSAEALVFVRCGAPVEAVLAAIHSRLDGLVGVHELTRCEPLEFHTAELRPGEAVPFNTDATALRPLGATMMLMGPGDMRCAHSERERLALADLRAGIEAFAQMVVRLG